MNRDAIYRELVTRRAPFRRTEGDGTVFLEPSRRRWGRVLPADAARATPGIQKPSLVSSCKGRIKKLLFMFPNWAVGERAYADAYASVITSMRPGTKFVVAHHESSKASVAAWFTNAGHDTSNVTLVPMPDYISMTDWAEDAYVALQDLHDTTSYLMEPWEFLRGGDALVADSVAEHDEVRSVQSPLIFQGGNCLIGDDFWLLGKDYFADTMELLKSSRAPVRVPPDITDPDLQLFARQLFSDYVDRDRSMLLAGTSKAIPVRQYHGRKEGTEFFLDVVGDGMGTFQPIFHIDMFITLVGRTDGDSGDFKVLVGSPKLGQELSGDGSPYSYDFVYDAIAKDLSDNGKQVIRNPLVHQPRRVGRTSLRRLKELTQTPDGDLLREAVSELEREGARIDTPVSVREFHHITWNNCLVENSGVEKIVYLPTFGHQGVVHKDTEYEYAYENTHLSAVDDYMKKLWKDELGFEPRMLGDFNPFAIRQGVVHCIKKYLERD